MKNKEIEEILNERKIDTYAIISKEEAKTILSYIEQLENNIDKAIEQCNDWIKIYKKLNSDERIILRLEEISRTLKGDSDE